MGRRRGESCGRRCTHPPLTHVPSLHPTALSPPQIFWEDSKCGPGPGDGPCELIARVPLPDQQGAWPLFLNLAAYTRQPVLVAVVTGAAAVALEAQSDGEAVAGAMAALSALYPNAPAAPAASLVCRWGQDPWARGAFSHYAGERGGQAR